MKNTVLLGVALVLACLTGAQSAAAAQAAAARIDSITPFAARIGERVSIKGIGFGAHNVTVSVGGVAAPIRTATGNEVTFLVPEGVAPGNVLVNAGNPGGHVGLVGLRVLEGVLLPGGGAMRAVDAIYDLPPVGADAGQIENGVT